MKPLLLTRDAFREGVFARDKYVCVICGEPATYNAKGQVNNLDAHHIIERRLFDSPSMFGGYFLDNGASLCSKHHIMAEQTTLSCEEIREAAGIKNIILPEHLYEDRYLRYDKWGNFILPNEQRVKGELFFDESVQKILEKGGVLDLFSKYVKYPRTHHLPWSEKQSKDDRILESVDHFKGKEVIVTVKMDGENTTMYNDYIHARSLDSGTHPTRNWVKSLWGQKGYNIPEGWRVCGENLYAVHTIPYTNLKTLFYVFSIWDDKNNCLSWDDTLEWCELLELEPIPVLYRGIFDEQLIKSLYQPTIDGNACEGYVIRTADSFSYGSFRKCVAKFVSGNFKINHGHWTKNKIERNELAAS